MKNQKFVAGLLNVILLIAASHLSAQTLKIETVDIAPYGFRDKADHPTGMLYEIGNRIAEQAGLPYINEIVPVVRTAPNLESGKSNMILRIDNAEIDRVGIKVMPITTVSVILFSRQESHFSTAIDFSGKTIGMVRGADYGNAITKIYGFSRYNTNDYKQMLRMVMAGHLDGGIGTAPGVYYTLLSIGVAIQRLAKPVVVDRITIFLYLSRNSATPKTIDLLQHAAKKVIDSGEVAKIIDKYELGLDNAFR